MKAMLLNAPTQLVSGNVDDATAGDGETLVRVTHTGVCGTDLKIYNGGIPVEYPRIMGHEVIGEIAEVGSAKGVNAGTRSADIAKTAASGRRTCVPTASSSVGTETAAFPSS